MLPVKTDKRKTTTAAEKEVPSVSRPLKKESKYPKELDPLGGSSDEEGSAISASTSPSKEVQVRMGEEAELVKKQDSDLGITVQGITVSRCKVKANKILLQAKVTWLRRLNV